MTEAGKSLPLQKSKYGRAYPGYPRSSPVLTLIQVLNGDPPANTAAVRVIQKPGAQWSYSGGDFLHQHWIIVELRKVFFGQITEPQVSDDPIGVRGL